MSFWNFVGKVASGAMEQASKKQAEMQKKVDRQLKTYENKINTAQNSDKMSNPEYAKKVNEAKGKLERAKKNVYGDSSVSANNISRSCPEVGSVPLKKIQDTKLYFNKPGVYILKLNGTIMKVGSAEIGLQKRMQQYYGLNKACGLNKHINENNRDRIHVEFQHCPVQKCIELESKLFNKYGGVENMPWAEKRPNNTEDTYMLKI